MLLGEARTLRHLRLVLLLRWVVWLHHRLRENVLRWRLIVIRRHVYGLAVHIWRVSISLRLHLEVRHRIVHLRLVADVVDLRHIHVGRVDHAREGGGILSLRVVLCLRRMLWLECLRSRGSALRSVGIRRGTVHCLLDGRRRRCWPKFLDLRARVAVVAALWPDLARGRVVAAESVPVEGPLVRWERGVSVLAVPGLYLRLCEECPVPTGWVV